MSGRLEGYAARGTEFQSRPQLAATTACKAAPQWDRVTERTGTEEVRVFQMSRWWHAFVRCGILAAMACSGGEVAGVGLPPLHGPDVRYVVTLTPERDTLPIGLSRTLTARVVDGAGSMQDVAVQWASLEPTIASVQAGNVTGVAVGAARIEARYGSAADTATVVVFSEQFHLQVWPSAISASIGDTVSFRAQFVTERGAAYGAPSASWAGR